METWHAYIDESYNSKTFCVGGFFAPVAIWDRITCAWAERIDHENRMSAKKGFPPITRYHATYCAGLSHQFSKANGWDVPRQIKFTKRLCEVLGKQPPRGIVVGGAIADAKAYLDIAGKTRAKDLLYSMCFKMCLLQIAAVMYAEFLDARVKVFYERSEFEGLAKEAYDASIKEHDVLHLFRKFDGADVAGWETACALQAADFMAYEGLQCVERSMKGNSKLKKSLNAMIGNKIPIQIMHFKRENFADIARIAENRRVGEPLHAGLESAIGLSLGGLGRIPGNRDTYR
ncbi:MAG: hypothetical protein ABSF62_12280 [Bryobacteraceae bacterium]|jgi:hypothetical protein